MKLRIISGELKGRYVTVRDGINFRPTQERVRESVAEIVKRRVIGAVVADLCAGSGAFGFEMVSRGAARVDFVEADKMAAVSINDNARAFGVDGKVRVIRDDVMKFADEHYRKIAAGGDIRNTVGDGRCGAVACGVSGYDIVYHDPPYDNIALRELVPRLLSLLKDGGLLIYERRRHPKEKKAADISGRANLIDARVYSDTVIEIYNRESLKTTAPAPPDGCTTAVMPRAQ